VDVALFGKGRGVTEEERARLAPGQHLVRDFPVLHAGSIPYREVPADWDFRIWGAVDRPLRWTYEELRAQDVTRQVCDIHCVTTWTKLDTVWEGVAVAPLLRSLGLQEGASHVVAHSEEGYTANIPLEVALRDDVLLAYRFDDEELAPEHGGPLRLLVPSLYFWKSAKWLRGLEVLDHDEPGFWERLGYSNSADPWKEERYGF
jgi:DMSO/TMAO reductase YedYZ molybdopterin-dependent catalytic subunit